MSETYLLWLMALKLAFLSSFVMLYVIGGRWDKKIRRWVAGPSLTLAFWILLLLKHDLNWVNFVLAGLYAPVLCLGYSGITFTQKLKKRLIYGGCLGFIALGVGVSIGHFLPGLFQGVVAVTVSGLYGTQNPVTAVDEEGTIALCSTAIILLAL